MNSDGAVNPYLPKPVTIEKTSFENEAKDLKTFKLVFCNAEDDKDFQFEKIVGKSKKSDNNRSGKR